MCGCVVKKDTYVNECVTSSNPARKSDLRRKQEYSIFCLGCCSLLEAFNVASFHQMKRTNPKSCSYCDISCFCDLDLIISRGTDPYIKECASHRHISSITAVETPYYMLGIQTLMGFFLFVFFNMSAKHKVMFKNVAIMLFCTSRWSSLMKLLIKTRLCVNHSLLPTD